MKILVMAQGQQRRLDGVLSFPKHFVDILGEPLIARTLRLLRQHAPDDITVIAPSTSAWEELCARHRARLYTQPDPGICILDGIHNTRGLWDPSERTVILLGDVVYSRAALRTILADSRPIGFAGRPTGSRITLCPHGELFGLGFEPIARDRITGWLDDAMFRHHETYPERIGLLWGLYHQLAGGRRVRPDLFSTIDDYTDDIDDARDLASLPFLLDALRAEEGDAPAGPPPVIIGHELMEPVFEGGVADDPG